MLYHDLSFITSSGLKRKQIINSKLNPIATYAMHRVLMGKFAYNTL